MKQLEKLPEIVDKTLGGLQAGQALKYRILNQAKAPARARKIRWQPLLAAACTLVMVLTVGFGLLEGGMGAQPQTTAPLFDSMPAGSATASPQTRAMLSLQPGSITLTAGSQAPAYRSIWATGQGSSFPLIGVQGRYYRLLTNPTSISADLLGENLGTVDEFTSEPALSDTDGILSNTVSQGENVYAVSGMNGAMVAANVDGTLRVFQRVTFGKNAVIGSEGLSDTLCASDVTGLELSGVGTITDTAVAQTLLSTLLTNAVYQSGAVSSGTQSLLIQLSSGLAIQMTVKDGMVGACGTWACPEFFEAFQTALGQ